MLVRSIEQLASADYLYLTTTGRESGKPRTVELWFVVHRGKLYMVSENPLKTNWVRNLQKEPRVGVRIESAEMVGMARVLDPAEQPLWDTVCRAACEKYNEPEPWGTPIEITPTT
jgi:deazaflavin-dependent oxidoreductase (nitroreductase family)